MTVTFPYVIADPAGETSEAVATIIYTAPPAPDNRAPDAMDDTAGGVAGDPVSVDLLENDSDPDGDAITVTAINGLPVQPGGNVVSDANANPVGVVRIDGGVATFMPLNGMDVSEVTFAYTIADTGGLTDTATVTIDYTPPAPPEPPAPQNQAPDAMDDFAVGEEGASVTVDLLGNDVDLDGDPLTITVIEGQPVAVGDTVPLTGDDGSVLGTITLLDGGQASFTPSPDNPSAGSASFVQFTYTVADPGGLTDTATATIAQMPTTEPPVTPEPPVEPVNADPVAADDNGTTQEGTSIEIDVLNNDVDPDGDTLSVTGIATPPASGTAVVNANGTITYTPNDGFVGTDSFTYTISDGRGGTDTASVTVDVEATQPLNDPPVATDDAATGETGTPLVIDLLGNDTDPNGDALELVGINGQPVSVGDVLMLMGGTVTIQAGGVVSVEADPDFVGDVVFDYQVSDGEFVDDGKATATFTAPVAPEPEPEPEPPVNNPPDAANDMFIVHPALPFVLPVLNNDADPDGDAIQITAINGREVEPGDQVTIRRNGFEIGVAMLRSDGQIVFRGSPGITGDQSFEYTISDGKGGFDTARVDLCIMNGNID